ncbi:hypothetical protein KFU94_27355 [Chloroflexi bacterium TSY]|nr:hypothetical protein [Chloroflexi bacterium TSY]
MILPSHEELAAVAGQDIAGYMEPTNEVGGYVKGQNLRRDQGSCDR